MIYIGSHIFDIEKRQLLLNQGESIVHLEPKIFDLLLLFTEQPNRILTRDDLLAHLWPGTLVTDNAVNKLIGNLRKILGDDAKSPRYIQTIPKQGYRFVCSLSAVEKEAVVPSIGSSVSASKLPSTNLYAAGGGALLLIIALVALFSWGAGNNAPDTGTSVALTRASGVEISPSAHPNGEHLLFLRQHQTGKHYTLWLKHLKSSVTQQIALPTGITHIIDVTQNTNTSATQLFYINKTSATCAVYEGTLTSLSIRPLRIEHSEKHFDCSNKKLKDIAYHQEEKAFYYTAQPQNYWPNHIYRFDIKHQTHQLVAQPEPTGWGHHSLDISPDGKKLLIMSTASDHKTQLLALQLNNNKMTQGITFSHPVYEAIWHHNSQQVFYFSAPPSNQIITSNFDGSHAVTVVNSSQPLSAHLSRFPEGKNILFSTYQENMSLRWLASSDGFQKGKSDHLASVDNSAVMDTYPALFHTKNKYLFLSKRSGKSQVYLADATQPYAHIVTNFPQAHSLSYLSLSGDDKNLLLNVENDVYLVPTSALAFEAPLSALAPEQRIYGAGNPIIALDWLTGTHIGITEVQDGVPRLRVVSINGSDTRSLSRRWGFGLRDVENPRYVYLIEQHSHKLYRLDGLHLEKKQLDYAPYLEDMQIRLPEGFYHVKIDNGVVYYVTTVDETEYINSVPITEKGSADALPLNAFSSYDVHQGQVLVSDLESLEGDIHSTVNLAH